MRSGADRAATTVTDWARQMLCCDAPLAAAAQELGVVGDRGYAALRLLAACQRMDPGTSRFLTRATAGCRPVCTGPSPALAPGQTGRPASQGSPSALPARTVLTDPATACDPAAAEGGPTARCGNWSMRPTPQVW